MFSEEKIALVKLHHTKAVGALQLRKIIAPYGSAVEACKALKIEESPHVFEKLEREKISILTQEDPLYPKPFADLKDPPFLLYVKGALPQTLHKGLTIIGTRTATNYGKEQAYILAKELAGQQLPIISGLARGIDSCAHRGGIEGGESVAIIGSGLLQLYPKENLALSEQISKRGAIVSEYPLFTPPTRYSFIERNRLLAALGKATLLIESPLQGGSMTTVAIASSLGRPLFALPALVDMPSFKGNFLLLKEGRARLLESAEDIFTYFALAAPKKEKKPLFELSREEESLYSFLSAQEYCIDELVLLTQLPIMKLNTLLTSLVLKGAIREYAGKLYKKSIV